MGAGGIAFMHSMIPRQRDKMCRDRDQLIRLHFPPWDSSEIEKNLTVGGPRAADVEVFWVVTCRDDLAGTDFSDTAATSDFPSRKPRSAPVPGGIYALTCKLFKQY
jgi:hypothetical protein